MSRPLALTMPTVTVWSRPKGLPIATTQSPGRISSESPSGSGCRPSLRPRRSSARSVFASWPTISAPTSVPSLSTTRIRSTPPTTWLLVTTSPSDEITKPVPRLGTVTPGPPPPGPRKPRKPGGSGTSGSCDGGAIVFEVWTFTTPARARSARSAKGEWIPSPPETATATVGGGASGARARTKVRAAAPPASAPQSRATPVRPSLSRPRPAATGRSVTKPAPKRRRRRSLAREQAHRAHAPAADQVGESDARALHLATARFAAQLERDLVDLRQARRPARVAAGDEPAVGVEGDAPAELRRALLDELLGVALRAEAQQLVVLELLVREGVVAVGDGDVARAEPRLLVGRARGVAAHARRADHRPEEGVAGAVGLGLEHRRPHGDHRPPRAQAARQGVAPEDRAGGAVVDRAGHHRRHRLRDLARGEHLLGRHAVVGLAVAPGTERAVVPVLGGDAREVLRARAALVHAPHRPEREVGRGQDHAVDRVAALAATPAARHRRLAHLVEAERHRDLATPGGHGVGRVAEGDEARRRRVLDVRRREPREPELLHRADPRHRAAEDVADEGLADLAKGDPGVRERGEPRFAGELRVRAPRKDTEARHPHPEHRHVVELHAASARPPPAGRKRKITTSSPCFDSRRVSSSSCIGMPMRKSSGPPESTAWTRGPSGRSTCPTA